MEPNELPDIAATREVREEAGVCGMLGRCLGVFEVRLREVLKVRDIVDVKFRLLEPCRNSKLKTSRDNFQFSSF